MTYDELKGFCSRDPSRKAMLEPWSMTFDHVHYAVATCGRILVADRNTYAPVQNSIYDVTPFLVALPDVALWRSWPCVRTDEAVELDCKCLDCREGKALDYCDKCGADGCDACDWDGMVATDRLCEACRGTGRETAVRTPEGFVRRVFVERIGRLPGPVEMGVLGDGVRLRAPFNGRALFFRYATGFGCVMPLNKVQPLPMHAARVGGIQ